MSEALLSPQPAAKAAAPPESREAIAWLERDYDHPLAVCPASFTELPQRGMFGIKDNHSDYCGCEFGNDSWVGGRDAAKWRGGAS